MDKKAEYMSKFKQFPNAKKRQHMGLAVAYLVQVLKNKLDKGEDNSLPAAE